MRFSIVKTEIKMKMKLKVKAELKIKTEPKIKTKFILFISLLLKLANLDYTNFIKIKLNIEFFDKLFLKNSIFLT